jgi:uncharacterized membrane protein YcaP (DUF421 family)
MELEPAGIVIRVSVMYLYALALVRISGKRSLGQLSPMDLIVTLIIGDLFDDVVWAEVPVIQGLVGFATIIVAQILVASATSRYKTFYWLLSSPASPLIDKGRLVQKSLQQERLRAGEVQFELRLKGEEHLREIKEARLESSGQVSVIKEPAHKPVQKKDKRLFR